MMQVQKGQVKYKDRSDIICTYGSLDDGRQYYFLDGEKLGKDRIVASTALVEAIDPLVMASNIGVIDSEGKVIIPFENKAIKPISDQAMLVEVANPVTPSVIEAANMRKDPLAATRLVTTPAAIKDKINAKMGVGGRFIFNDQFSEASVYDLDGNNLLDNKLYSFIGYNNGVLYLAGNTVDTDVVTYSLNQNQKDSSEDSEELDVKDLNVSSDKIDEALSVDDQNDDMLHPVEIKEKISEESDFPDGVVEEEPATDENESMKEDTSDETDTANENNARDESIANETVEPVNVSLFKHSMRNDFNEYESEFDKHTLKEEEKNNKEKNVFDEKDFDIGIDSNSFNSNDDSIIEDTAEVMAGLIRQNKKQRETINSQDEQLESLIKFKRKAFEENRTLVEANEALKKRLRMLEKENLENTENVTKLQEEVSNLRSQVAGKSDLAKLIADAKDLLGSENN